ncbi:hypothetical protein D9M68_837610 [compost metagenome]
MAQSQHGAFGHALGAQVLHAAHFLAVQLEDHAAVRRRHFQAAVRRAGDAQRLARDAAIAERQPVLAGPAEHGHEAAQLDHSVTAAVQVLFADPRGIGMPQHRQRQHRAAGHFGVAQRRGQRVIGIVQACNQSLLLV